MFDGACVMCSRSVRRMIAMDRRGVLVFAALESVAAERVLAEAGVRRGDLPDSMVLICDGQVSVRSEAILGIATLLGRPYSMAKMLRIVPRFVRDYVYGLIARNRHRIGRVFGGQGSCDLMTPEIAGRFLK
jgi:predicted DCC family thiol-disulfide oxidoreductase YuxK